MIMYCIGCGTQWKQIPGKGLTKKTKCFLCPIDMYD